MNAWVKLHLMGLLTLAVLFTGWMITKQPPNIVILGGGSQQIHLSTLTASATSNHLPPWWRQRLLASLGAPINKENLLLLQAWGDSEGGTAQWNPLNTTYVLSYGESWSYNASSVQNYWRPTGGVAATALTLVQNNYSCILAAIQNGKLTAAQTVAKCGAQFKAWGTNPDTIARVLAQGGGS